MKLSTAITGLLSAFAAFSEAAPLQTRDSTTPITGVSGNGVQVRKELRQMQRENPDQFNLYLLGLRRMMNVKQSDPLSWYQIAGIHGRPYTSWDGSSPAGAPKNGGYCTHVSNIFLTWHRPYLALFEQTLYGHVQAVASSFPAASRARYQAAAKTFRIPYWDWAAPPPCATCLAYPKLISAAYLDMDTPSGRRSMPNPLFRYDFQGSPSADFVYDPFASWKQTKRDPTSWASDAVSQNDKVAAIMNSNRQSLHDRLYNLLTNYKVFNHFSNEAWQASSNTPNADSLESVHDAIHSITGSNGHMTYLDYAAFDPVFFLHHTMVDRVWALWSSLNPDTYVAKAAAQAGTYAYPSGTEIDVNFPLYPFSKDTNRNYLTSADVRTTTSMGYTYPELANGASVASIRKAVNTLYGSASNGKMKRDLVTFSKRDDGKNYHYIANVAAQKFVLDGSYNVFFYLGTPPTDSNDWATAENLVGTYGVFANLKFSDSISDGMKMDTLVTGTVPLTTSLVSKCDSGELEDLEPETVTAYLKQNLTWRVAMLNGNVVPVENLASLSVSIITSDVTPASSDDEFPTWGGVVSLPAITLGKEGGFDQDVWNFSNGTSVAALTKRAATSVTAA